MPVRCSSWVSIFGACTSSLPAGTPNDPTQYIYLRVQLTSGVLDAVAIPWIDDSSVTLVEPGNGVQITVGGAGAADVARLQLALVQNGYNNLQFTVL
jgi:hypothetical protein